MALVLTLVLSLLRLGSGKPSRLGSLSRLIVVQHFDFFSYMIAVQWGGNIFLVCLLLLFLPRADIYQCPRLREAGGSVKDSDTVETMIIAQK